VQNFVLKKFPNWVTGSEAGSLMGSSLPLSAWSPNLLSLPFPASGQNKAKLNAGIYGFELYELSRFHLAQSEFRHCSVHGN